MNYCESNNFFNTLFMPIIKSAKKALRQSFRKRAHNVTYKQKMKDLLKQVKTLASQQKIQEAKKMLPAIYKILDKAAKEKVIKKNAAARGKSRITKLLDRPVAKEKTKGTK